MGAPADRYLSYAAGTLCFVSVFFVVSPLTAGFALASSACPFEWTRTLTIGATGDDVLKLQELLNQDVATRVAASGPGSSGMETSFYGAMTRKAVIAFQEKYASDILAPNGLARGTGLVAGATRAKLNSLCAAPSASLPPLPALTAPIFTIAAAAQPAGTLALSNALYVPFTNATLTAGAEDVTVSRMTVERIGPANDRAFANINLIDGDGVYIATGYFNSNHQAVFKTPFTIPKMTSKEIQISGDMNDLTDHQGEMAALAIISVEASHPVTGPLPLSGAFQTMNSTLAIGSASATLSPEDPRNDRTRYILDTGIVFSGLRITAGSQERLKLYSVTWDQAGSAGADDIANLATVVKGVSYPAVRDDRSYTSEFPDGIIIEKGDSLDLYIQGNLTTSGSGRTLKFDIREATDVYLTGERYGFGIYLVPGGNTDVSGNSVFITEDGTTDTASLTPFFSGSSLTISGGAVTSVAKN